MHNEDEYSICFGNLNGHLSRHIDKFDCVDG